MKHYEEFIGYAIILCIIMGFLTAMSLAALAVKWFATGKCPIC